MANNQEVAQQILKDLLRGGLSVGWGDTLEALIVSALAKAATEEREACADRIAVEIDKLSDEMNASFARDEDVRGELYRGMLEGAHVALKAVES